MAACFLERSRKMTTCYLVFSPDVVEDSFRSNSDLKEGRKYSVVCHAADGSLHCITAISFDDQSNRDDGAKITECKFEDVHTFADRSGLHKINYKVIPADMVGNVEDAYKYYVEVEKQISAEKLSEPERFDAIYYALQNRPSRSTDCALSGVSRGNQLART